MQRSEDPLVEGIAALKAGKKSKASRLLKAAVQQTPRSAEAWLWLGASVSTPGETLYCLERVLELDPDNQKAQTGIQWARSQVGQGREGAIDPLSGARQTSGRELVAAESTSSVGLTDGGISSVIGSESLARENPATSTPDHAAAFPAVQPPSRFFPNLLIAVLAIVLVLGILIIVALLRAWLG